MSVSLCVAARWPAAELEATFGCRVGCLCFCVLLPAGRRPGWKPQLVAVLAVCVSVCCCPLAGGHVGRHIWPPCRLTVFCARCCPSAGGQIRSHIWSPNLLSVSLCVVAVSGGQLGSHIWSATWLPVYLCAAGRSPGAKLEASSGCRVGCLC